MEANVIQKEEINGLKFGKEEVLDSSEKKMLRYHLLKQGELLGNAYKQKTKLFFRTLEGHCMVYTTIWFANETHVQLKGGVMIPVRVIEDVMLSTF